MFQSYAWNLLAAHAFGRREAPRIVMVESDSGTAIVPAAISQGGRLLTLLGEALFDYRDVLSQGDPDLLGHAWRKLAEYGLPLSVPAVREDAALLAECHLESSYFCASPVVLQRQISAEAFAARHPHARRQIRRLHGAGAAFHRYPGAARALLQWIYERKAEQSHGTADDLFSDRARSSFVVAIAGLHPQNCDVYTAEASGHVVSALVTFRDRDVRRFYTIWYDQAWREFSPGIALLFHATAAALAQGQDCDYLTGEQPHKLRFATAQTQLFRAGASSAALASGLRGPAWHAAA